MSALGNLHTQNGDLEFFSAEKRKFRKKIPLETDFQTYWMILKKSIFLGPKPRGGAVFFCGNDDFPPTAPYKIQSYL